LVLYHRGRKRAKAGESGRARERGGRAEQGKAKAHFCQVTESQSHRLPVINSFSVTGRCAGTNNSIQLERGILAARRARSRTARQGCWWWWWWSAAVSAELPLVCQGWMDVASLRRCDWAGNPRVPFPPFAAGVRRGEGKVAFTTASSYLLARRADWTAPKPNPDRKRPGRPGEPGVTARVCAAAAATSGCWPTPAVLWWPVSLSLGQGGAASTSISVHFRQCQPEPTHGDGGRGVVAFLVLFQESNLACFCPADNVLSTPSVRPGFLAYLRILPGSVPILGPGGQAKCHMQADAGLWGRIWRGHRVLPCPIPC